MEADELVHREVFHEVPPRVEYSLTPLGVRLNEALLPLGDWGEDNMQAIARRRGVEPAPKHCAAGVPPTAAVHDRGPLPGDGPGAVRVGEPRPAVA